MPIITAYICGLVGVVICASTWPGAFAAVYGVSGGLMLLALAVHLVKVRVLRIK